MEVEIRVVKATATRGLRYSKMAAEDGEGALPRLAWRIRV